MKAVGLVVEYNPFHNGHHYHAEQARKQTNSDIVIAVMSASFLQRGEPALVSKWYRTKMALLSGVDIVLELPYVFSTQKAELFARGAVTILSELDIDTLNFGSERGDINAFLHLVQMMDQHQTTFDPLVKLYMTQGKSYPRATSEAFRKLDLDPDTLALDQPNNILGFHYVKALQTLKRPIQPTTTLRTQAGYHDQHLPTKEIASATSIRRALQSQQSFEQIKHVVPQATYQLLKEYQANFSILHDWELYYPTLQYKLLSSTLHELRNIYECEEGLEYRLKETIRQASSFSDWMTLMKTKRYTWTRLQRLATHVLTNTTKEEMNEALAQPIPYIRLLGMTEQGQAYLNKTKSNRSIPLATRLAKTIGQMATIEQRATDVYLSALHPSQKVQEMKNEYSRHPIQTH